MAKPRHKVQGKPITKREEGLVSEETKLLIKKNLFSLMNDEDMKEICFPTSFSNIDRKFAHAKAREYGLKSKSKGVEPNRILYVYKGESEDILLTLKSTKPLLDLFQKIQLNPEVPVETQSGTVQPKGNEENMNQWRRLKSTTPHTNMKRTKKFREMLPIAAQSKEIVSAIENGQIIIIVGETGSGKTTQVPQMILEYSEQQGKGCQVICSMPRRVAAITISERVAFERGESLGQTVGYQIKLESKISEKTCLTYCTNGILLRFLLTGNEWLRNVSHIIIDEIHERDKITDFTLIALKDILAKYKHLKLILMSATIDTNKFKKYFKDCPETGNECQVVEVPGRMYDVKDVYLENILEGLDYMSNEMYKEKEKRDALKPLIEENDDERCHSNYPVYSLAEKLAMVHPLLMDEMDALLKKALNKGEPGTFRDLIKFMAKNKIPVDYPYYECGRTALMAAVTANNIDAVDHLIYMNPDPTVQSREGKTALMYAVEAGDSDILQLFDAYSYYYEQHKKNAENVPVLDFEVSSKVQELVDIYEQCHLKKDIDEDLILNVLKSIHADGREGAVLVFLPGYEHIVCVKEKILENRRDFASNPLDIHILHSKMKSGDQKKAFEPAPKGHRKVVLATNIAETSVTINDISFVIDCGKVKELSYISKTGVYALECDWISRACAEQRRGRAGRTTEGVCFRLYSKKRFREFRLFKMPDILREPIAEICLQSKQLAPTGTSIAEFLGRAVDPPLSENVINTINLLKGMEALTEKEDLSDLGRLLLKIPMEPHFGKMIVYGAILRCLDPVLNIVCCLSSGEVFKLPVDHKTKEVVTQKRLNLAKGSYSDHLVYHNTYRGYQKALILKRERSWCQENFVNLSAMEMIRATKDQISNQLDISYIHANENAENWATVKAALTAGSYLKIAKFNQSQKFLQTPNENRVMIHPSSVLKQGVGSAVNQLPSEWLLYEESLQTREFSRIRTCSLVSQVTICIFAGPSNIPSITPIKRDEDDAECEMYSLNIDSFINFKTNQQTAKSLLSIREKWNDIVRKNLKKFSRSFSLSQDDEEILEGIVNILENEDASISDTKQFWNIGDSSPEEEEEHHQRPISKEWKRGGSGFTQGGRGFAGSGRCFAGDNRDFARGDKGFAGSDRSNSKNSRGYVGSDSDFARGDRGFAGSERDFAGGDRSFARSGRGYAGGEGDFAQGDKSFARRGRGYAGGDGYFTQGDQSFARRGRGYAGADGDFAQGDKNFARRGRGYAGGDGNFAQGDKSFARRGRGYASGDVDFAQGDQSFSRRGRGYAGGDGNFAQGDQSFARRGRGYARDDRDFAQGDRSLTRSDKSFAHSNYRLGRGGTDRTFGPKDY